MHSLLTGLVLQQRLPADTSAGRPLSVRLVQGMSNAEKRATVIQLVDAWRKAKQVDAEAAKEARTMSRSQCEEVRTLAA